MQAETFLAALSARRRSEQQRSRQAHAIPTDFTLPRELEIAVRHGWFLQPVLARSVYFSASARVGVPDNCREQIAFWTYRYQECLWELALGRDSDVMAMEVETQLAAQSIAVLCGDDWGAIERTLRFDVGADRWVALFHYSEDIRCWRLPGIRLLTDGQTMLVPPARLSHGIELLYVNPFAPLGDPPPWLFEPITLGAHHVRTA